MPEVSGTLVSGSAVSMAGLTIMVGAWASQIAEARGITGTRLAGLA